MENSSGNTQLVEKLTTILEQAKNGELSSFAAVTFKQNGGMDQWGVLTRHEDMNRVVPELEVLAGLHPLYRTVRRVKFCW
jgi:hypothetical protein